MSNNTHLLCIAWSFSLNYQKLKDRKGGKNGQKYEMVLECVHTKAGTIGGSGSMIK
ncbi:hypothetical protein AGMMS49990_01680 [Endomicrobiia bacterium]|nr:hypothetical protein AGMMS49990_01680 [Endomicrobiia bacterium]